MFSLQLSVPINIKTDSYCDGVLVSIQCMSGCGPGPTPFSQSTPVDVIQFKSEALGLMSVHLIPASLFILNIKGLAVTSTPVSPQFSIENRCLSKTSLFYCDPFTELISIRSTHWILELLGNRRPSSPLHAWRSFTRSARHVLNYKHACVSLHKMTGNVCKSLQC